MKLRLLIPVLIIAASCAGNNGGVKFFNEVDNKVTIDLGNVKEIDGAIDIEVRIPNTTEDTLTISKKRSSCRCFSFNKFKKTKAAPGEDMIVSMIYDPAYMNGDQEEYAGLILSNGQLIDINLTANVTPCPHAIEEGHPYDLGGGIHVSHRVLSFARLAPGESRKMYFHIANGLDKKAKVVLEPRGEDSHCIEVYRQPGKMDADGRDTIHVTFTMPEDRPLNDTVLFELQPFVDGVPTETPMKVRAICVIE